MTRAGRRRLVLGLMATGGGLALGPLALRGAQAQEPREIAVVAQRFRFTPQEIPVKLGERVVLALRAEDFAHGFSVPELSLRADLVPGRVVRVELQPMKAGRIDFLCDNFCGDNHEDMSGYLLVTP